MTRLMAILRALTWRAVGAAVAVIVVVGTPWWGTRLLAHLSFFRAREVQIIGARYLQPDDVIHRMRVDTLTNIWTDLGELERRAATLAQVRAVTIDRELPGTLVVHVTENLPIAYVGGAQGLRAVDADGRFLPIDPSRIAIDLPVLVKADTSLLHLLAAVKAGNPSLYGDISGMRRQAGSEISFTVSSTPVRALAGISAQRLADIVPVEADLARRKARVTELDLRFRDQVIARTQ